MSIESLTPNPEREAYRRHLTDEEKEYLHKRSTKVLSGHGTPSYPTELPAHPGLKVGSQAIAGITGEWRQHDPFHMNRFFLRTNHGKEVKLEQKLSDIFDQPSDPEITEIIAAQLERQPYAEFSARHFPGFVDAKTILFDSSNPYLNPLEEFTYDPRESLNDKPKKSNGSSAMDFAHRFSREAIPVIGAITPSMIRACLIDGKIMVSAYSEEDCILTNWRDLEDTTISYSLPREMLSTKEIYESFGLSADQPQILFTDQQVERAATSLSRLLKSARRRPGAGNDGGFNVLPPYEDRRQGKFTILFRQLGSETLERVKSKSDFSVETAYDPDDKYLDIREKVFFQVKHHVAIKPDEVAVKDGTLWMQDNEAGLEVPYRYGSPIDPYFFGLDTKDLRHMLDVSVDNRFLMDWQR